MRSSFHRSCNPGSIRSTHPCYTIVDQQNCTWKCFKDLNLVTSTFCGVRKVGFIVRNTASIVAPQYARFWPAGFRVEVLWSIRQSFKNPRPTLGVQEIVLDCCISFLEEGPKDLRWLICHFTSLDKSAATNLIMGYPQVPGSISADIHIHTCIFRGTFSDLFVTFQWSKAGHLTEEWVIRRSQVWFWPKTPRT